jgi:hypothetical protein
MNSEPLLLEAQAACRSAPQGGVQDTCCCLGTNTNAHSLFELFELSLRAVQPLKEVCRTPACLYQQPACLLLLLVPCCCCCCCGCNGKMRPPLAYSAASSL